MPINNNSNNIVVIEDVNKVVIPNVGIQGPRGKTILNGTGAPADNLGLEGDFYYDKNNTYFYGPKLNDLSWAGTTAYPLSTSTLTYPFSINQVTNQGSYWALEITHNMGYMPNVTLKNSAGDILETGKDYNSINKITLTMAQPFGGTAFLS